MIIEVDGDKFYYEKLSNRGCSANRKVMMVLVVVISLCVLLLLALFYVVLSRTWSTRTRTSSFKKAEIDFRTDAFECPPLLAQVFVSKV